MFTEKMFDNLGVDMIASNDSMEESMEKYSNSIGGGKYQTVITDLGKALLHAARMGNTEKVHELMSRGAPFTADWLGTTPLHLAARYNHIETCKVLLRAGISKDSKTKVDRTPLHMAVFHGNIEVVELLLGNKCEVDAKDMLKMTALHWAVEKRHDKIVEMLLQHGSDPNAVSKFGKSPIELATDTGQMELVRILLLANQMRAASSEQVQEATDSLMYELQQHKERHLGGQTGKNEENLEDEDNITMELSNDSNLSQHTTDDHRFKGESHDTDNLIEKEDNSLSDAITNLEQSTRTDARNLDTTTLQMLKEHGIALMPSDDTGSLITSAIKSGRKIVLSEAGKFALKETRNLNAHNHHPPNHHHHSQQSSGQLQKQTLNAAATVHSTGVTLPKAKTFKIIKKQTPASGATFGNSLSGPHPHQQPNLHHGATPTLKTNKVIKILSPEEFQQICGGDVRGMKRVPSVEYKKTVASTTVRVPINSRQHVIPASGSGGTKQISKFVTTKSGQRIPVLASSGTTKALTGEIVKAKLSSGGDGGSTGGISIANGLSGGHNRHIITSADGVKRLRTSAGMEIISALPTKLPQDTVVSVESLPTATAHRLYHRVANQQQPVTGGASSNSNLMVEVLERQMLELKKLTEDLRKQFELSQKQNEEYRTRVEKLEKEVHTLKQQRHQQGGRSGTSLVELV